MKKRKERIDGRYFKKKKSAWYREHGEGGGEKNRNAGRKIHGIRNTCFSVIRDTRAPGRSGQFSCALAG